MHTTSTESSTRPSLLVAASHALLCDAIAAAAAQGGCEVRTARDGHETITELAGWRPELILLDLALAAVGDFDLLRRILQLAPRTSVVLISGDRDPSAVIVQGFVRGAIGVASKDRGVTSLMRVLDAVAKGEAAIPRQLSLQILKALQQAAPVAAGGDIGLLSDRQREVLLLVAEGLTDREISMHLGISLPTVRSHLEAIFQKTSTSNRTAAARWAHHNLGRIDGATSNNALSGTDQLRLRT